MSKNRIGKTDREICSDATWKGQPCDVLNEQTIQTSQNQPLLCATIRVHKLPLHQGLRLVPMAELIRQ